MYYIVIVIAVSRSRKRMWNITRRTTTATQCNDHTRITIIDIDNNDVMIGDEICNKEIKDKYVVIGLTGDEWLGRGGAGLCNSIVVDNDDDDDDDDDLF